MVLQYSRRRKLTVMTTHVNAIVLISHKPNIFPADVWGFEPDMVMK